MGELDFIGLRTATPLCGGRSSLGRRVREGEAKLDDGIESISRGVDPCMVTYLVCATRSKREFACSKQILTAVVYRRRCEDLRRDHFLKALNDLHIQVRRESLLGGGYNCAAWTYSMNRETFSVEGGKDTHRLHFIDTR